MIMGEEIPEMGGANRSSPQNYSLLKIELF
jgi:hypothetical protein